MHGWCVCGCEMRAGGATRSSPRRSSPRSSAVQVRAAGSSHLDPCVGGPVPNLERALPNFELDLGGACLPNLDRAFPNLGKAVPPNSRASCHCHRPADLDGRDYPAAAAALPCSYKALSGHCCRLLRLETLLLVGSHLAPVAATSHVCEEDDSMEVGLPGGSRRRGRWRGFGARRGRTPPPCFCSSHYETESHRTWVGRHQPQRGLSCSSPPPPCSSLALSPLHARLPAGNRWPLHLRRTAALLHPHLLLDFQSPLWQSSASDPGLLPGGRCARVGLRFVLDRPAPSSPQRPVSLLHPSPPPPPRSCIPAWAPSPGRRCAAQRTWRPSCSPPSARTCSDRWRWRARGA